MLPKSISALSFAAFTMAATSFAIAQTQPASPTGVWIDHTGRGAVEITDCNGALCGHIVWVKDSKHLNTCRNQVLGNVKAVGGNTWDRGWIVDPDDDKRYSVELKPIGADRLRVMGYMGSKFFSETMTWKRAPADLKRCDGKGAPQTTPAAAPAPAAPLSAPAREAALSPAPIAPGAATEPRSPAPGSLDEPASQPQRQAAAPPAVYPGETTRPAPAASAESQPLNPQSARPSQSRTAEVEVLPPAAERDEPAPRGGKRKSANRTCKVELPYITLNYPCDAF